MTGRLFNGQEWHLRRFGGASASRVSHRPGVIIGEHRHDWLNITIHLLGACDEEAETGSFRLDGPSVTMLPAGSQHANRIGAQGLETIGLLVDPAWLKLDGLRALPDRPINLRGGTPGIAARRLAAAWMNPGADEAQLASATAVFLKQARDIEIKAEPSWLGRVRSEIDDQPSISCNELARRLDLHPAWLARAYRRACGEGLAETLRRRRVERALVAIRHSAASLATVAIEAGFCDQPHMNRCFWQTLGATPHRFRATGDDERAASLERPISRRE